MHLKRKTKNTLLLLTSCCCCCCSWLKENINYFTVHKTIKDHFTPLSRLTVFVIFTMQNSYFTIPIYDYNYCRVINVHGRFSFFLKILYYKICIVFHKQLNFSLLLPFHACKTSNLVLSFWEWESPPRTPKA
jgi:hypothetical protein